MTSVKSFILCLVISTATGCATYPRDYYYSGYSVYPTYPSRYYVPSYPYYNQWVIERKYYGTPYPPSHWPYHHYPHHHDDHDPSKDWGHEKEDHRKHEDNRHHKDNHREKHSINYGKDQLKQPSYRRQTKPINRPSQPQNKTLGNNNRSRRNKR